MFTIHPTAKQRACPYAMKDGELAKCLGDECMGWRWLQTDHIADHERRGYCGAAGQLIF